MIGSGTLTKQIAGYLACTGYEALNDDALRAIELYCDLVAEAILDGIQAEVTRSGKDAGAAVDLKVAVPAAAEAEEPAKVANAG